MFRMCVELKYITSCSHMRDGSSHHIRSLMRSARGHGHGHQFDRGLDPPAVFSDICLRHRYMHSNVAFALIPHTKHITIDTRIQTIRKNLFQSNPFLAVCLVLREHSFYHRPTTSSSIVDSHAHTFKPPMRQPEKKTIFSNDDRSTTNRCPVLH